HARKWGVQVVEGPIEIKTRWNSFELNLETRAKRVLVNCLGAARAIGKIRPQSFMNQISHWLYYDRFQCPLELIPEPVGERGFIRLVSDENNGVLTQSFHLQRDKLRDQATLTVGVWL